MKHIDFDDMVKLVYSEKVDNEYTELAARVNKHIYSCPQCMRSYEAVCSIREFQEEYQGEVSAERNIIARIMQKIYKNNSLSIPLNNIVDSLIDKIENQKSLIEIKLKSFCEIATSNFESGFCFYHPQSVGVSKGTGDYVGTELKDVLIDDNYNRISIALDGTLSIRFQKQLIDEGDSVYLIPYDENSEVLIGTAKISEDGMTRVSFDDVVMGDYVILY